MNISSTWALLKEQVLISLVKSADRLKDALATTRRQPRIRIIVRHFDRVINSGFLYRGGLTYPRLERLKERPDLIKAIIAPRI